VIRAALQLAAASLALLAAPALAGDVTVTLTDTAGKPVRDAVVTYDGPGAPAGRPARYAITQRDMTFIPFVLVVPVGSTVDFSNLDPFRHHVYSFSPAKRFEIKLFGQGEKRAVTFDTAGVVAIGCNIHDSMQAFVYVTPSAIHARTGADGKATLRIPGTGAAALRVWHPMLRAPGNQLSVQSSGAGALPVRLKLRRPAPMSHDY